MKRNFIRLKISKNSLIVVSAFFLTGYGWVGAADINSSTSNDSISLIMFNEIVTPGTSKILATKTNKKIASSKPKFGSVTQSSNTDNSGLTTDTALATFDGKNVILTITDKDGGTLELNSATDIIIEADFSPSVGDTAQNYAHDRGRAQILGKSNTKSVSAAYVRTFWDSSDPTEYRAGGYWLHLDGDFSDVNLPQVAEAEVGAFIYGPKLEAKPTLHTGRSRAAGAASGLYVFRYGNGRAEVPEGSYGFGDYGSSVTFTTNFTSKEIAGCIGCEGDMKAASIIEVPSGKILTIEPRNVPYKIYLNAIKFKDDGTFLGSDIRLERMSAEGITAKEDSMKGFWGGRLSTDPDSGDSHLLAGTIGLRWTESDGSEGAFIGVFLGQE